MRSGVDRARRHPRRAAHDGAADGRRCAAGSAATTPPTRRGGDDPRLGRCRCSRTPTLRADSAAALDWGRRRMARFLRRGSSVTSTSRPSSWSRCWRCSAPVGGDAGDRRGAATSSSEGSSAAERRTAVGHPDTRRLTSESIKEGVADECEPWSSGASSGLGRCIGIGLAQRGVAWRCSPGARSGSRTPPRRPATARRDRVRRHRRGVLPVGDRRGGGRARRHRRARLHARHRPARPPRRHRRRDVAAGVRHQRHRRRGRHGRRAPPPHRVRRARPSTSRRSARR